ncbi:MAG: thiamine ABC transporter substrate binding subunit [Alphaproteobacteria bacterium]|nr:thiamine ABC transporter substrate binding subunit [Alphaproteobacteria bacterium]
MRRLIPFLIVALCLAAPAAAAPRALTVYTYASFVGDWGPGQAIATAFETTCACTVRWIAVEDAGVLLSRLRLEGGATEADVILGLDTNLMAEAEATGLLAPHGVTAPLDALPIPWTSPTFVPFDFGWFAFIYDAERMASPAGSLRDLIEGTATVVIQDPRTSTPGLGLLLWMRQVFGDEAGAAWVRIAPRIVTVTKGWSEAYGLFLDGEADMVLSYTTSPAYHRIAEQTERYRWAPFAEGHALQVEVAAMVAATDVPDLARAFLAFIPTRAFQTTIPTGNWMMPVIDLGTDLPAPFAEAVPVGPSLWPDPAEVAARRKALIDDWLDALAR